MKKWQCVVCGLIYDEAEGWPDDGIAAITCVPVLLFIAVWVLYQRPRQIREVRALG